MTWEPCGLTRSPKARRRAMGSAASPVTGRCPRSRYAHLILLAVLHGSHDHAVRGPPASRAPRGALFASNVGAADGRGARAAAVALKPRRDAHGGVNPPRKLRQSPHVPPDALLAQAYHGQLPRVRRAPRRCRRCPGRTAGNWPRARSLRVLVTRPPRIAPATDLGRAPHMELVTFLPRCAFNRPRARCMPRWWAG
jgi:hypothetical protein